MNTCKKRVEGGTGQWVSFKQSLCSLIVVSFAMSLSLVLNGCSDKPVAQAAPSTNAWSWQTYPSAEKMRLATLPCQIQPRTSLTINAPVSSQLRLYVDRPQTNLNAGFLWGEFEPK